MELQVLEQLLGFEMRVKARGLMQSGVWVLSSPFAFRPSPSVQR